MTTKNDMERFYAQPDPWGYQQSQADLVRREMIAGAARAFSGALSFQTALDVGCGEGWITTRLPAYKLYGYELSDSAASRFRDDVKRYDPRNEMTQFDLVLFSGVLYSEYDWERMLAIGLERLAPNGVVITCHIVNRMVGMNTLASELGIPKFGARFEYRRADVPERMQQLLVWKHGT